MNGQRLSLRFWFAWHFAGVKSNQAKGGEMHRNQLMSRCKSAITSTDSDRSKQTVGVKTADKKIILVLKFSLNLFMIMVRGVNMIEIFMIGEKNVN